MNMVGGRGEGAPHPLDVALGRNIRLRRKSLGMSQSALGEAVGLTFQQVQKYERGKNRVSFSKLAGIAGALQCRISDLIDGLEEGGEAQFSDDRGVLLGETGALELLQCYAQVRSPKLRRAIISLAKGLSDQADVEEAEAAAAEPARAPRREARTRWRRRA
jgi:transcriptional regulator with XRE-family HTH domain